MSIKILDIGYDKVIDCKYLTVKANYKFAIENLTPLITKLDFQRNALRSSFYARLETDIINGCIMPPLTIAYKLDHIHDDINVDFLNKNLDKAFVLDGIQRLNTLNRIKENVDENGTIFLNILICNSMNKLLYRMITLNNGQKPMSARHQIEILANNLLDFETLPILSYTQKETKSKSKSSKEEYMNREIIIKGYLAFISNSVNFDNQKIIESKLDEIIAEQIMDANLNKREIEYTAVLNIIAKHLDEPNLNKWFLVPNNFIAFSASMSISQIYYFVSELTSASLYEKINLFENAFSGINISTIKVGVVRRRMVKLYFEDIEKLSTKSANALLDVISQEI